MVRLPIVNEDDGTWGGILRDFIMQEHVNDDNDASPGNGGHKNITITAGTSSAGGAPLKFTSGTLLSTEEAGAMEFAGDHYYLTTNSGTRKKIATYDEGSPGATGDLYYRNSSGYFTRLPVGSANEVLTVSGGLPVWQAPTSSDTFSDADFTLQNDAVPSKQLQFDLSAVTAGHTTTLRVPEVNGTTTIATTDTTQALTNKTLTRPVVDVVADSSDNPVLTFASSSDPVNSLAIFNADASAAPGIAAGGTDTDVPILLRPQGGAGVGIWKNAGQDTAVLAGAGEDANVNLNLISQGTGTVKANGVDVTTISGAQTLTDKTLTNPSINNYTEGLVAIGVVTTSHTLNLTNGTIHTATLTASTACTFTMPAAVAGKSFTLFLKQAASTGNGSATFTGVKWTSAGAPIITITAGKMDILTFFSDGTNWYGSYVQGYTP